MQSLERNSRYSRKTLAIDIPSGLSCDEGQIDQEVIKADITVTFLGEKKGFYSRQGLKCRGQVFIKDIGLSGDILDRLSSL